LQDPASGRPFAGNGPAEGAVFGAIKSDHLHAPALLTEAAAMAAPDWVSAPNPTLERIVVPANERDEVKLGTALARLSDTDGGLTVTQDPASGAHVVATQGPVHLREVLAALSETFRIEVSDNGRGFDVNAPAGGGYGLQSMRERAALIGGTLTVASAVQDGATVALDLPVDESAMPSVQTDA
jgi:hypothetical protein